MTREEVVLALVALPAEDAAAVATSLAAGVLLRAMEDRELAPLLAELLDLQGVVILVADRTGPRLESTSHDDATQLCKDLMKRLHDAVAQIVDDVCLPRPKVSL